MGRCSRCAELVMDGGTSSGTDELTSSLTCVVVLSSGGVKQERAGPTQAVLAWTYGSLCQNVQGASIESRIVSTFSLFNGILKNTWSWLESRCSV